MDTLRTVPDLPGSKDWKEHIKEIVAEDIQKMVDDIHRIQTLVGDNGTKPSHNAGPSIQRGFHAKGIGLNARFRVREDVPPNLRVGLFAEGGRSFNAIARFSNAISVNQKDSKFDQRGLPIRIFTVAEIEIEAQDDKEQNRLDEEIEKMAFSPWNTKDFKPLGTMNEARKLVYDQSAEKRGGCPLHMGR